jgi:hypothetical protein
MAQGVGHELKPQYWVEIPVLPRKSFKGKFVSGTMERTSEVLRLWSVLIICGMVSIKIALSTMRILPFTVITTIIY